MFMLIIWLQGIWLPLHGYSFQDTPLWAGIYMLPLTVGFLIAGPTSGYLSDRFGARPFATGGMLLTAACFLALELLPVNFTYSYFATFLLLIGTSMGLFSSPNLAGIMNSLPPNRRGVGAGMVGDVPELGDGALDRHLLLADGAGPGRYAAQRDVLGTDVAGRPGRRRAPHLAAAPGGRAVCVVPGLQPDQGAARPARSEQPLGPPRRLPDRPQLLPRIDLQAVCRRACTKRSTSPSGRVWWPPPRRGFGVGSTCTRRAPPPSTSQRSSPWRASSWPLRAKATSGAPHQLLEERGAALGALFGMPQHSHGEARRGILDRLDRAIR